MKNHNFVALVLLMVIAVIASLVIGLIRLGVAIATKAPVQSPSPAMVYAPIFEEPVKVEGLADPWAKPYCLQRVPTADELRLGALKLSAKAKNRSLVEMIRDEAS
jgi:hypothetical protein